jgi:hypothetical protein
MSITSSDIPEYYEVRTKIIRLHFMELAAAISNKKFRDNLNLAIKFYYKE